VFLFRIRKNGTYILNKHEFSSRLRSLLGFRPHDLRIYEIAFIHRSASFLLPDGKRVNNERLEYLGDSVLDAILSEYLFCKFPDANEGFMTKVRARIVKGEVLNQLAVSMGLDKLLVSNVSSSQQTRHLYGNALEALIGAVFLDRGFKKAKKFFIEKVLDKFLNFDEIVNTESDYKSLIFEWVQKKKTNLGFKYNEEYDFALRKSIFTTVLSIDKEILGTGQGASKKEAEQEAAFQAWEKLRDISKESD
jgi:ribonuclease-3